MKSSQIGVLLEKKVYTKECNIFLKMWLGCWCKGLACFIGPEHQRLAKFSAGYLKCKTVHRIIHFETDSSSLMEISMCYRITSKNVNTRPPRAYKELE